MTSIKSAHTTPLTPETLSPVEIRQLLHELQVHQIELEMQNDELCRTQHELEASHARYFELYELAPVGYLSLSGQGLILKANLTAATMLGVARGVLVAQPINRFIFKDDRVIFQYHKQNIATGELQACELRMVKRDGTQFWAHLSFIAVQTPSTDTGQDAGSSTVFRVALSDISEHKLVEALQESELNYRTLADSGQALIWTARTDKLCDYFNKVWLDFTGRTYEQEFGNGWTEGAHPDDVQRCLDVYTNAFDLRETFSMDYRLRRHDGEFRWIQDDGCPRYDIKGKFAGYIGYCLDITERKAAEDALKIKSSEIEQFTYSVSHDLRSPLVTVTTFLEFLEQDIATSNVERIEQDLQHIRSGADKMERLLNGLMEMSRIGRQMNTPVSVTFRELADEAIASVAGQIAGLKVTVQVADADLTLVGDRPRLAQIWQNLLDNAVKYMGAQAAPCITISVEHRGNVTCFCIRDNGIGIAPGQCEKLFGMFEKLDQKSAGAGLGLALARRIVEVFGGRIWVESAGEGHGSCFYFTLPGAMMRDG